MIYRSDLKFFRKIQHINIEGGNLIFFFFLSSFFPKNLLVDLDRPQKNFNVFKYILINIYYSFDEIKTYSKMINENYNDKNQLKQE